jgi:hypothetical protein
MIINDSSGRNQEEAVVVYFIHPMERAKENNRNLGQEGQCFGPDAN